MQVLLQTLAILAALTFVASTQVKTCKSGLPLPVNVQINDCQEAPCLLPQGSVVHANITFDAPEDIEILTPKVRARAIGVDVNYPLQEKDACKALLDAECPLEEGERITYQLVMPILKLYPTISLGLEITLYTGEEENPMNCFQIDCKVTKPQ